MVKRKISKEKYLFAFFIATGVFLLGLLLGLVIDGERVDFILFRDQEQRLDLQSLHLQYQFADQFTEERNCDRLLRTFDTNLRSLESTRRRVENYRKDTSVNEREFDLLKREYTLSQINYWLLYSRAQKICELDASTVLYFFANEKDCPDCEKQAVVLTWLKHKLDMGLLNFVFDGDYDDTEPIIKLLKDVYNIDSYPTIVINGEVFHDFTTKDEILAEICPIYKDDSIDVCKEYLS